MENDSTSRSSGTHVPPGGASTATGQGHPHLARVARAASLSLWTRRATSTISPDAGCDAAAQPAIVGITAQLSEWAPMLNRRQAAKYLNLAEQTLAAWASNKRVALPYSRLGRRVVYRRQDLDAYLAAHQTNGAVGGQA